MLLVSGYWFLVTGLWFYWHLYTNHTNQTKVPYLTIKIEGMTCNHCKESVEDNLKSIYGIKQVNVDLANSRADIIGENIDLKKIESCLNSLGYKYKGEVKS